MTITEYLEKSLTTAIYPNKGNNFPYVILGLNGESIETFEKLNKINFNCEFLSIEERMDLLKELGDILWYLSSLSFEFKIKLDQYNEDNLELSTLENSIKNIIFYCGIISESGKKIIRNDNHDESKRALIELNANNILKEVDNIAVILNSSLEEVMQINIDKLFSRQKRNQLNGDGDNR